MTGAGRRTHDMTRHASQPYARTHAHTRKHRRRDTAAALALRYRYARATANNAKPGLYAPSWMMIADIPAMLLFVGNSEKKLPKVLAIRKKSLPLPP